MNAKSTFMEKIVISQNVMDVTLMIPVYVQDMEVVHYQLLQDVNVITNMEERIVSLLYVLVSYQRLQKFVILETVSLYFDISFIRFQSGCAANFDQCSLCASRSDADTI